LPERFFLFVIKISPRIDFGHFVLSLSKPFLKKNKNMETTYEISRDKSGTAAMPEVSREGWISRKALITFISGAAIVFSIAIYYCVTTNHGTVGAVLAGAFGVISAYAFLVHKAFK
jgi:hypothetical protein